MSLIVNQLCKSYGDQKSVDQISFTLNKGEVVGFLGPNGAGKSTTMKMIVGYLHPDAGTIELNGTTHLNNSLQFKKWVGYLPESNALYEDMFVREYLSFLAEVHSIKNPATRIEKVIVQTGLGPVQSKTIGQLSKGYKQRLGIAGAILHEPILLLLDEPTAGLDPNQLIEIRTLIKSLSANCIILFSSHILQEVAAICSRVLVLNKGKLVADEPIENLLQSSTQQITVVFDQDITLYLPAIKELGFEVTLSSKQVLVTTCKDSQLFKHKLMEFALLKGLHIQSLNSQTANLEEIFKLLTH